MRRNEYLPRGRTIRTTGITLVALVVALGAVGLAVGTAAAPRAERGDIPTACGSPRPFFAVARFPTTLGASIPPQTPSLTAFRDSLPDDATENLSLATFGQTGSVFGLAYDATRNLLYAAAFHKRGVPFGPGGPGGVYRVDVASGTVTLLAKLPAGADLHNLSRDEDAKAASAVGQTSLGGLALDPAGDVLYVANLADQKIYRLSTMDGAQLGSSASLADDRRGRLFALAVHDGSLFQGIVRADDVLRGYVYRSDLDGGNGSEAVSFDLTYGRRPPWFAWESFGGQPGTAQPLLTDIVFRPSGDMVLGLRDRRVDMTVSEPGPVTVPGGDIVPAWRSGTRWQAAMQPERYDDDGAADEVAWGGLAAMPGLDQVVATVADTVPVPGGRALVGGAAWWFDNRSGQRRASEQLYRSPTPPRGSVLLHGLGDIAALCDTAAEYPELRGSATAAAATEAATATLIAAQTVSPTLTAEATMRAATATAYAGTATAGAPATATQAAQDILRIRGACASDNPFFFTSSFIRATGAGVQTLDEMMGQPALVAFNDTQNDLSQHIVLANQGQVGTIYGLAWDYPRGQLYAAAYHKRVAVFGPGGPGAIYRVNLTTGVRELWANLPAGPDFHDLDQGIDDPAAAWVGKSSLGDIDLSADGRELFVMNLWDRRVYRLSVPDGALLGSFPAGDEEVPWVEDARPFSLGYRDGWLYQGVVDVAERSGGGGVPVGYVYRSRADGSELEEVARFDFDYPRPAGLVWQPWSDVPNGHQPMLTDIEFRPNGDPILGVRDRYGDQMYFAIGQGDLLPTVKNGARWDVVTDPEFYQDDIPPHIENPWGALAAFPHRDWVVTSSLAPVVINSGGALWYDNTTGTVQRNETVYDTFRGAVTLPTFAKSQGLGDLESFCPEGELPTPTPTDTATASATPTGTSSPTPTATRVPLPIYLPVVVNEECTDRNQHADVVVVIDMSTSMDRRSTAGRRKLEAAQAAVRAFVGQMKLAPDAGGYDQVAIVGFNDSWWIEQGLTADRAALGRAIDALPNRMAQGTRLDLAVTGGLAALAGPGRNPANTPVMVLLTDGLPNRVPTPVPAGSQEDTVRAAAQKAKDGGVRLYTVGLGEPTDIDAALLSAMASAGDMFYYAPDAEALAEIYAQIAYTIGCPSGRHDWGRPWP
jgi:Mg-chelatase subunit ChlD